MLKPARLFLIMALALLGLFSFMAVSFSDTASPSMQQTAAHVSPVASPPDSLGTDSASTVRQFRTFLGAVAAHQQSAQYAADQAAAQAAQQAAAAKQQQAQQVSYSAPAPSMAPAGNSGWQAVAICEEGGRNDPTYGYFGIMPGNWPPGESPANMSWDQQVALGNQINGGGPPSEAGGCHGW